MISAIKELLQLVKDSLTLIAETDWAKVAVRLRYLRRYRRALILLAASGLTGAAVWVLVDWYQKFKDETPERTIRAFYNRINAGDYKTAWDYLTPGYQQRRWNQSFDSFKESYADLVGHTGVRLKRLGRADDNVAIYADLTYIIRRPTDTLSNSQCLLVQMQKDGPTVVSLDWLGVETLIASAIQESWKIAVANIRGECGYVFGKF